MMQSSLNDEAKRFMQSTWKQKNKIIFQVNNKCMPSPAIWYHYFNGPHCGVVVSTVNIKQENLRIRYQFVFILFWCMSGVLKNFFLPIYKGTWWFRAIIVNARPFMDVLISGFMFGKYSELPLCSVCSVFKHILFIFGILTPCNWGA